MPTTAITREIGLGGTSAINTGKALRTDIPTAATIVRVILGVHARTTAVGLPRGTGACPSRRITIPATALTVRIAAQTIAVALGLGEGRADASQTENATDGRSGNSFEGLAA